MYGAPAVVQLQVNVSASSVTPGGAQLDVDVAWFGKRPTRMAESLWWEVNSAAVAALDPTGAGWTFDKLGVAVNPNDVGATL